MTDIVVVFHSGYGHTQRMAQAVAEGAGAQLLAIDADGNLPAGGWELLAAADAIILGSPTYMGGVSWQFKKFADASSKVWYVQGWKDKLFAGFTNSAAMNGDKDAHARPTCGTLAMQHSGLWVSLGLMPSNDKAAQARFDQLRRRLQRPADHVAHRRQPGRDGARATSRPRALSASASPRWHYARDADYTDGEPR